MSPVNTANFSARTVWGKVVLFLKEHRYVALHVACGDITDVEISGNELIINAKDGMLFNLLINGKREIESALRWQGLNFLVKVNLIEDEKSDIQRDYERLAEVFGENLIKRS